ncbi:MAG: PEGA domain-containing protein, partial [Patescibacteria group bacterium]
NWKEFTIVKTGAIYVRSIPINAEIYVNGKQYKSEDGIISRGTLVKNLKPGTYEVVIKKDGFSPWKKNISVEKSVVSSESFIKLWRNNPQIEEIASSSIRNFWVTDNGILLQDNSGNIRIDDNIIRGNEVVNYSIKTGEIITKDKNKNLFFIDVTNPNISTNIQELFNSLKQRELKLPGIVKILTVFPHPFSRSKIIVATKTSLYIIDLKRVSIEKILETEGIVEVFLDNTRIFVKNADGNIAMVNLLIKNDPEIMYTSSTEIYAPIINSSSLFFIGKNNILFNYDRTTKSISTVAQGIKYFSLSPEEKRLGVIFENGTLGIIYIANYSGNMIVEKGVIHPLVLNNGAERVNFEFIEWLPGYPNYLVASTKNSVWAIEANERNPQNATLLSQDVKKYTLRGEFYFLDISNNLKTVTY